VSTSDSIYWFWSAFELGALRARSGPFIAFRRNRQTANVTNSKNVNSARHCATPVMLCIHWLTCLSPSPSSNTQYRTPFFIFCYILFNKRQTLPAISLPFICLDVKIPRKAKWTPQWLHHVTLLYKLLLFVLRLYWWQRSEVDGKLFVMIGLTT
jgi:hypothetical protein